MRRLLVMLVLAATVSPAAAQPWPWPYDRTNDRSNTQRDHYSDRYDRYGRDRYSSRDRYRWTRDFRGRWTPLAQGYSARTDRQFVRLLGQYEPFRRIRIEADRGRPVIQKVVVEDMRGNTQVIDLNARYAPGEGEVIRVN